jgi:hypothetical protein
MRLPPFSPIRFATLLSIVTMPACFSLPHIDPGNRVLDDFDEDAGITQPTWSAFGGWKCEAFMGSSPGGPDAGQNGGPSGDVDAGQLANPDGGQPVSCGVGPGSGSNSQALVSSFDVVAPAGAAPFGVEITTTTKSGSVDLTNFTQFLMDAELYSTTMGQAMLPSGTNLEVDLGCSKTTLKGTPINQTVNIRTEALGWSPVPALTLEMFSPKLGSLVRTCLAEVDRISFKVLLGPAAAGTQIAGTLKLDNIAFK